jgi:RNA-binding protein
VKLTAKQRQYLKGLAHGLEPVVRVGKAGATAAVVGKTVESLRAHELIKVRIDEDNPERDQVAEQLAQDAGAHLVSTIGKLAILYRRRDEDPKITLPR